MSGGLTPPPRGPLASSKAPKARKRREAPSIERALGHDPFDDPEREDPFIAGLAALDPEPQARRHSATSTPPLSIVPEAAVPRDDASPQILEFGEEVGPPPLQRSAVRARTRRMRPQRHKWVRTPRVDEVDLPERDGITGFLEGLISEDERRHVAALSHMVQEEGLYDRFGFSPDTARRAFPYLYALYRLYFRVQSHGHENLPVEGPAILAGNHGGLLPFDGAMTIVDTLLHTDPPRLPRAIVDTWAGTIPWVNVFYARVGQVIGTRENMSDLLAQGQLLLVFPEGMDGARKTIAQRYQLQQFHVGFVEQALISGAPIVPVAIIGNDDQTPILYDLKPIAKKLGLPVLPITPTFPWLGPAGLLPYPVRYKIVYGEPIPVHEQYGPNDAEDPKLVHYLARRVRNAVQRMLDRER